MTNKMKREMRALVLEGSEVTVRVGEFPTASLPEGEVTLRVTHSCINYKDAMIAAGVRRMVRTFPHIPGVDLAGVVVDDRSGRFQSGAPVIVTGYDLGVGRFGGYAQYARVPADWIVPLPAGLTPWEAMALGTAGLTAMLSLMVLERNGLRPDQGPVIVPGKPVPDGPGATVTPAVPQRLRGAVGRRLRRQRLERSWRRIAVGDRAATKRVPHLFCPVLSTEPQLRPDRRGDGPSAGNH